MDPLEAFMPHGMCYLWRADILALHVVSDAIIALSYFTIPAALIAFLRKRPDLEFPAVFKLFIAFILACGVTHAFSIVVVWEPLYVIEGLLKLATALISAATAIMLWPLIPRAVAIPSPQMLAERTQEVEERNTQIEERNARIETLNAELADRIESLSALAGGVAHDFNNLLTVITGRADLMASGEREPSRAEHLNAIAAAADRATALCRQMLAYSGKGHFVMQRGDLGSCIDSEHLRATPDIEVELDLAPALPEIQLAPAQVRQLVDELVRNGLEAIVENGALDGRVLVRTKLQEFDAKTLAGAQFEHELTPGPAVVIEVIDNGGGIAPFVQRRMFDPYFSTRFVGRGLGMAAVQGICRGHGAALWLETVEGHGTTVRVAFPLVGADTEGYREREHGERYRRVLILDDEPGLLDIAQSYCKALGMEAVTTDDPDQAIELLLTEGSNIDAVILDYLMPLKTGDEVLAEIRAFSAVDVYLSSGFSRGELDDAELQAQLTGFLPKPFRLEDFRRVLEGGETDDAPAAT